MYSVFLGIGSNLGDKQYNLQSAIRRVEEKLGIILKVSSSYETEAWGIKEQSNFLNAVIKINTSLHPFKLMNRILDIELEMGRIRSQKWNERSIDIDILFIDDIVIHTEGLIVPHPYLCERNFVLQPLFELESSLVHPQTKMKLSEIIKLKLDDSWIKKL